MINIKKIINKKSSKKLDLKLIQNYLTFRYNPVKTSIIPFATTKNFNERNSDSNGIIVQSLLENVVKNQFENYDKPIIISLSGGIDSTLCSAILRKVFPKKKIIGICAVFENGYDES